MSTETLKVLGQSSPAATTLTPLYTVPGATQAAASTLIVCNQNSSPQSFRVSVAVAGAADDPSQYLFFDLTIAGNDTFAATIGISLGATDVVRVYASATGLSFSLYGAEVT